MTDLLTFPPASCRVTVVGKAADLYDAELKAGVLDYLRDVQDAAGADVADRLIGRLLVSICWWLQREGRAHVIADLLYEIEAFGRRLRLQRRHVRRRRRRRQALVEQRAIEQPRQYQLQRRRRAFVLALVERHGLRRQLDAVVETGEVVRRQNYVIVTDPPQATVRLLPSRHRDGCVDFRALMYLRLPNQAALQVRSAVRLLGRNHQIAWQRISARNVGRNCDRRIAAELIAAGVLADRPVVRKQRVVADHHIDAFDVAIGAALGQRRQRRAQGTDRARHIGARAPISNRLPN